MLSIRQFMRLPSSPKQHARGRRRSLFRPHLESLEDRLVLDVYVWSATTAGLWGTRANWRVGGEVPDRDPGPNDTLEFNAKNFTKSTNNLQNLTVAKVEITGDKTREILLIQPLTIKGVKKGVASDLALQR